MKDDGCVRSSELRSDGTLVLSWHRTKKHKQVDTFLPRFRLTIVGLGPSHRGSGDGDGNCELS